MKDYKTFYKIFVLMLLSTLSTFTFAAKSTNDQKSALYEHVNFFSDPETGDVTINSIKQKLIDMHVPEAKASLQALLIGSFNQSVFSYNSGCPFATMNPAKYGVGALFHGGTSRINKKDGSLNLQRLERFKNVFSEDYRGKRIITKEGLQKFLEECRKLDAVDETDNRPDTFGIEQAAIDAAWNAWFELFTSGWKEIDGKPGEFEPYVTPEQVDQFFKHPKEAWMTVVNKEVPVPEPSVN